MSHALVHPIVPQPAHSRRPPPLENGDRLTRVEFERRFEATPGLKKAELLEGAVYMPPPPVSHAFHGGPHADLGGILWMYRMLTPGLLAGDNSSLRFDVDNMPQPDVYLMIPQNKGGQARIDEEGYVAGAPEWVGEVAGSSASIDLHLKMQVYRRTGVREYVVWRTYDWAIDYFVLREGLYAPLTADADGLIKSELFPGLWLDTKAMLQGNLVAVAAAVQKGCASTAHADFVARLAAPAAERK